MRGQEVRWREGVSVGDERGEFNRGEKVDRKRVSVK